MIQRYSITTPKAQLSKFFKVAMPKEYKPAYNAAQSQQLPVITSDEPDRVKLIQWGIVPYSSTDAAIGDKLINARAKLIKVKQPYCDLLANKRCIVLADGFYIWKDVHGVKTPYRVTRTDGAPFLIAGVWDEWQLEDPEQKLNFKSFSMVTVPAFELTEKIEERMPAILTEEDYNKWLSQEQDIDKLVSLLKTSDDKAYRMYKVSNHVNNPDYNKPRVAKEIDTAKPGDTLGLFD